MSRARVLSAAKVAAWNLGLLLLLFVGAELGVRAWGHFVQLPTSSSCG